MTANLLDFDLEGLAAFCASLGEKRFRATQLFRWIHQKGATDFAQMSDLAKSLRDKLAGTARIEGLPILSQQESADGTIKWLFDVGGGNAVETVFIPEDDRGTLCVSSQAGCVMACPFCATGQGGLQRNMSTAEIVEQVVAGARALARDEVPGGPGRVSNVVFMGMGEPMANYNAVIGAVRRLTDPSPAGLGMSARGVTVSTVGLVPRMRQLADEGIPVTLALSLHAPDDKLRDELIPVNSRWKVEEALDAARNYFDKTGRRVSIEYALIKDMNDHAWRADLLAEKLNARGRGWVHVNPIPLNPTPGSIWTASDVSVQNEFVRRLNDAGIPTTLRDTRGKEIDGACGQLVATTEDEAAAAATPTED